MNSERGVASGGPSPSLFGRKFGILYLEFWGRHGGRSSPANSRPTEIYLDSEWTGQLLPGQTCQKTALTHPGEAAFHPPRVRV